MSIVPNDFQANKLVFYRHKKKISNLTFSLFRYVFLISVAYVLIYPLCYMISVSVKAPSQFNDPSVIWIPNEFTIQGFKLATTCLDYLNGLWSTLKYEIVSALIEVGSCAITAYGLARFKFKGKKFLMAMLIVIIIVPEQMTILPKVMNFSQIDFLGIIGLVNKFTGSNIRINILNTGLCFWLPSIFAVGLRAGIMIYIYIQFFKGLPKELEEAAWIDGASPIKTFFKIVLPSSTVVIFVVTIFSVIWHYNDYYLAVMYINEKFPLAVALNQIQDTLTTFGYWSYDGMAMSTVMAGCIIFILPMLLLYIAVQKKFVKNIDRIGITG